MGILQWMFESLPSGQRATGLDSTSMLQDWGSISDASIMEDCREHVVELCKESVRAWVEGVVVVPGRGSFPGSLISTRY